VLEQFAEIARRTDAASFCLEKLRSASHAMLCVICLETRVVLDPLVVLNKLGGDMIRQVGGDMIKDAGLKMSDPNEHLKICDR
jgi:hypothetical protein